MAANVIGDRLAKAMRTLRVVILSAVVILLLVQISLAKNGNIGVYGIVDKVVFEPDESSPERIQIWGLFAVPIPISSGLYKAPQRGVLYFSIPADRKEIARKEWVELKRMAGSGRTLGFTEYWVANPSDPQGDPHTSLVVHVHQNRPLGLPDAYPLGIGVLRIEDSTSQKTTRGRSLLGSRQALPSPEQSVNGHALVRAVFEATAPARHPSRRASIARRSLPDRTPR
jgi:hypothetical protein